MKRDWVELALAFVCGMLTSVAMAGLAMGGDWELAAFLAVLAGLGAALWPKF